MNGPNRERSRITIPVTAAILTILVTYIARLWVERGLAYGEPVPLAGDLFRLSRGDNPGVAFGLFDGSPLVPWLAMLALAVFALVLARPMLGDRAGRAGLGLILGGGIANLLDRVGDGRVTDYLDAGLGAWRWPTFNLPDVAITTGLLLVLWALARDGRGQPEPDADHAPADRENAP